MEKKGSRGGRGGGRGGGGGGGRRSGGGGGGRGGGGNSAQRQMVRTSKTLSYLLRHGAIKEGLHMTPTGWVEVDEILALPTMQKDGVTLEDVKNVVENNDKKRFTLKVDENTGKYIICANQGQSLPVRPDNMRQITSAEGYSVVLHGTYFHAWEKIKQTGLCKMGRQHIHFAPGDYHDEEVVSGRRANCEIAIHINLAAALADGIEFWESANKVILTEGIDGYLPTKYFTKAVKIADNSPLEW